MAPSDMSRAEAEAVMRIGLGGRPGRTYWTGECYESAGQAKSLLALKYRPEVRMEFRITNDPKLLRDRTLVAPDYDEPGGAAEYVTLEAVEVEVVSVDNLD